MKIISRLCPIKIISNGWPIQNISKDTCSFKNYFLIYTKKISTKTGQSLSLTKYSYKYQVYSILLIPNALPIFNNSMPHFFIIHL